MDQASVITNRAAEARAPESSLASLPQLTTGKAQHSSPGKVDRGRAATAPLLTATTPLELPSTCTKSNNKAQERLQHPAPLVAIKERGRPVRHTREAAAGELLSRSLKLREFVRHTHSQSSSFTRLLHRRMPVRVDKGGESLEMVRPATLTKASLFFV
jgi:hypothetical protein